MGFLVSPSWAHVDDAFEYTPPEFSQYEGNYAHNIGSGGSLLAGDVLFVVLVTRNLDSDVRSFSLSDLTNVANPTLRDAYDFPTGIARQEIWTVEVTGTITVGENAAGRILKMQTSGDDDHLLFTIVRLRDSGDIEGYIAAAVTDDFDLANHLDTFSLAINGDDDVAYFVALTSENTNLVDTTQADTPAADHEFFTHTGNDGVGETTIIWSPATGGSEVAERFGNHAGSTPIHVWALGSAGGGGGGGAVDLGLHGALELSGLVLPVRRQDGRQYQEYGIIRPYQNRHRPHVIGRKRVPDE